MNKEREFMDITGKKPSNQKILRSIKKIIEDKSGSDISILDVSKISDITDYFILSSCKNERHIKAMFNEIKKELTSSYGLKSYHADGDFSSHWVVLDYGFCVIHLFLDEIRKHYALEELWSESKELKV